MNIEEKRAKQLHYDLMGIALAVRGHNGEDALFEEIDSAISALDWRRMAVIQYAFDMLSPERRAAIMGDDTNEEVLGLAIRMFSQILRTMLPENAARSA